MIKHGIQILNVTPRRILEKAVALMVPVFLHRHVVIDPENIEVILANNSCDLGLHPLDDHGISDVKVTPVGEWLTVAGQDPVGMFFAKLRSSSSTFNFHP